MNEVKLKACPICLKVKLPYNELTFCKECHTELLEKQFAKVSLRAGCPVVIPDYNVEELSDYYRLRAEYYYRFAMWLIDKWEDTICEH